MTWGCSFNDNFEGMLNLKNLFWKMECEPYSKAFKRDSSPKLIIEGSVRQRSSWRFCLLSFTEKKFDFSTTVTHGAYTIFELMTEFMFKSLNFCCSVLSNFTPIWSCIENSDLCFDLKNCVNIDLNYLIDLGPRMEFPKLFDSLTQTRNKEYLNLSVL